ncbi:MAG: PAS domain S-box protein, partial [Algicola sp.]|nr:PAS domain S-box protein [Algicola sp.]
ALLWGGASIGLFPANDVTRQVFLAFAVGGMAAGSLTSLAYARGPSYLFLLVSLVPLAVRFFINEDELGVLMGLMLTFYLLMFLYSASQTCENFEQNIGFQFESKRRENQLNLSRQKLALHVQNTPLGLIECDSDMLVTQWNPAAEQIFGFSEKEAMGHRVDELIIAAEVRPQVKEAWDKVINAKDGYRSTNQNITKTGNYITCEWYNTPLVNDDGMVIGVASLVQDVTKKLASQKDLKDSEASFRALFELSDEAMMTMGGMGVIDSNMAALRLFGYSEKSDILGLHPADFSPKLQPDGKASFDAVNDILDEVRGGGKNHFQWVHQRASGEDFIAEVRLTPMVLKGRNVVQAIIRDISEAKRAEALLIAAKLEAEDSSRAKSEFLSRMSHELRTPLNAILGFAQILLMQSKNLDKVQKSNLDQILIAGDFLLSLINELLDMAKIASGKLTVEIEPVKLDVLLEPCLFLIERQRTAAKVTLDDQLSALGLTVLADELRLKQVLLNLLTNAVKYNSEQGCIVIKGEVVGSDRVRISVSDTGPGFTEVELGKLFTPFERLNALNNIEGTGIGLSISKQLMEAMDGTIGVSSKLGEGCTFWLELPREL